MIKNKWYILYYFLIFIIFSCTGKKESNTYIEGDLNKNRIFLVFRETNSKNGFLAKEYNMTSSSVTHIGLGFFDDNKFKIINIDNINQKDRENDILISSLDDFFNLKNYEVISGEIWEYHKDLKSEQIKRIARDIDSLYTKSNIRFDTKIDYNESEKMYCSELVSKLLDNFLEDDYKVELQKKKLAPVHRFYLRKDTIEYIPVDYFCTLTTFKKVYSFRNKAQSNN